MTFLKRTKIYFQSSKPDGRDAQLRIPSELAKALHKAGYDSGDWFMTDEGLLVKPARSATPNAPVIHIDLPDWA
jgi:hypothetical protein